MTSVMTASEGSRTARRPRRSGLRYHRRTMAEDDRVDDLANLVRAQLPNADDLMVRLVTSTVGLLAGIAWADGAYPESEQQIVADRLQGVDAFSRRETAAMVKLLAEPFAAEVAAHDPTTWTVHLMDITDVWQRRQILDVLVDVAVADGALAADEDRYLSETASAFDLEEGAYAESLGRHPDVRRG